MRLLALDTTGSACAVALRVPGRADVCVSEEMLRGQAERLAPMAQDVLAEAGIEPGDLDRIGVTTGPGSFAGTRVGVAFARGLALATGAECVGISNLEWWARHADPAATKTVLVAHDAKRGEVVTQVFSPDGAQALAATLPIDDAVRLVGRASLVTGSGAGLLGKPSQSGSPGLTLLLDLAEAAQPPFERPKPFYARPPDAKLPGGRLPE